MAATAPRTSDARAFGVVVPVKPAAVAKSRLGPLGDHARRELVGAFAVDTVLAALECPLVARVLVVTDEVPLALAFRELGVQAVPDGESGSLNASLRQGAAELVRQSPGLRLVALCADLPALRAEELAAALAATDPDRAAFVADSAGVGTTLYTAPSLEAFEPQFGARSCEAHLASGAVEVRVPGIDSLRRDVDTPEDLRTATELGVGSRTSWVVTSLRLLDT
jgi:2-phospho-L-lactate/phosphoenolpyruvate guanylyltransferase